MSTITAVLVIITGIVLVLGWRVVNKKETPRFRRDTTPRDDTRRPRRV